MVVIVGGVVAGGGMTGAAVTVNPPTSGELVPADVVTVTSLAPGAALAAMVTVAVICVVLLETKVAAATPVPEKVTAEALEILVPVITTPVNVAPCCPVLGFTEVTVGKEDPPKPPPPPPPLDVTENPLTSGAPSPIAVLELVAVTSLKPIAASEVIAIVAVMWVSLTTTILLATTLVSAAPAK